MNKNQLILSIALGVWTLVFFPLYSWKVEPWLIKKFKVENDDDMAIFYMRTPIALPIIVLCYFLAYCGGN
jgi:hypothetical protein